MTKYQLTKPGGPWDYPTLGFSATDGAILDGTLSTPAISTAPDAYWAVYGGGSAETGITRYGTGTITPTPEVADGWVLAYDGAANTYIPTDPAPSTGWRDISDDFSLDPGLVLIQRTGDDVTIECNPQAADFDLHDVIGTALPAGFRPRSSGSTVTGLPLAASDDGGGYTGTIVIAGNGTIQTGSLTGTFHTLLGSYKTSDAWPTVLPGVAFP